MSRIRYPTCDILIHIPFLTHVELKLSKALELVNSRMSVATMVAIENTKAASTMSAKLCQCLWLWGLDNFLQSSGLTRPRTIVILVNNLKATVVVAMTVVTTAIAMSSPFLLGPLSMPY
jgi:hypothetical protein